jgi:hypothetical protein
MDIFKIMIEEMSRDKINDMNDKTIITIKDEKLFF